MIRAVSPELQLAHSDCAAAGHDMQIANVSPIQPALDTLFRYFKTHPNPDGCAARKNTPALRKKQSDAIVRQRLPRVGSNSQKKDRYRVWQEIRHGQSCRLAAITQRWTSPGAGSSGLGSSAVWE